MTDLLQSYLDRVPGGMEPTRTGDGEEVLVSVFSPHSIRATTATILDGQEVARAKIQKLLGHKKPETTDGYCQTEHARSWTTTATIRGPATSWTSSCDAT